MKREIIIGIILFSSLTLSSCNIPGILPAAAPVGPSGQATERPSGQATERPPGQATEVPPGQATAMPSGQETATATATKGPPPEVTILESKRPIVERIPAGQEEPVEVSPGPELPLDVGDRVGVREMGWAFIKFRDYLQLELFNDSQVALETVEGLQAGTPTIIALKLIVGSLFSRATLSPVDKGYVQIGTKWATITTLGTEFLVYYSPYSEFTWVLALDQPAQAEAQGQTVTLNAGYMTKVEPGQPPDQPRSVAGLNKECLLDSLRDGKEWTEAMNSCTATPTPQPVAVVVFTPCLPPPADWGLYTVRPGDTLGRLAFEYYTTVEAIKQANCTTADTLYVGERIFLPRVPPTPTPRPTPTPCLPGPCKQVRTVEAGETLADIAGEYGLTVEILMETNCLLASFIYEGQQLCIPVKPPQPVTVVLRAREDDCECDESDVGYCPSQPELAVGSGYIEEPYKRVETPAYPHRRVLRCRSFFDFDLSAIPTTAAVQSAEFTACLGRVGWVWQGQPVSGDAELLVSESYPPGQPLAQQTVGTTPGPYEWDVTDIVVNWQPGDHRLYLASSREVITKPEDYDLRLFVSLEMARWENFCEEPLLTITYLP